MNSWFDYQPCNTTFGLFQSEGALHIEDRGNTWYYSVEDPGFPRGEGGNSKGGCEKLLFSQFFPQKLQEIERIWTWGRASLAPPPTPCVKFRKYFEMRQCQKIHFKVLTRKSMRKFFFSFFKWPGKTHAFFSFLSGQEKLLILQQIWFYIIISISK